MPSWNADRYLKFAAERCYRTDQSLPGYPGRRANWGLLAAGSSPTWGPNLSFVRETSTNEWIDDTHAGVHEISTISRGNRQTVDERRRRDEAILDWHGFPGCAKTRQQFCPFQPGVRVPGKTVENPDPRVEPTFQGDPLPSLGKDEKPESEFAEDDGIDGDISLMCAKPRHDPWIGRWFRRLAQNVGID